MRLPDLLGSAAVVVGATLLGCESASPLKAAGLGVTPADLVLAATEPPAVRSQKPEAEPPSPQTPQTPQDLPGEVVARIRATVNGVPILESECREAAIGSLRDLLRVSASDRVREERKILDGVLDQIVDRELLYQDAISKLKRAGKKDVFDKVKEAADKEFQRWVRNAKTGFRSDDEFKLYLQSMGTSMDGQRRLRERMFIAEEYLRSNVLRYVDRAAGPREILDYYRSHPEEFTRSDSVQWQDIFVLASKFPTREEARRFAQGVASRAQAGEDFVALCQKHDDGLAKDQQGAGIGTERGKIRPPEVEKVLFTLEQGQVGPLVELRDGFHIVKVTRREYAGLMPFDEKVQQAVKDKIRNDVYQKERKKFIEELRRNAQVEKFSAG